MGRVALCVIGHCRPRELADALASAGGKGFDEVIVLDMASDPPLEPQPGARWLRSDENLGVARGRNLLLGATEADYVVFLDDDAVFRSDVSSHLRERFDAEPDLGAMAFRVVRSDGTVASSEYPFRGRPRQQDQPRPCAYFVGCGYAARRSAVAAVGGYDEGFFYSTEEVDLSFKLMHARWRLVYDPAITIEHRPSSQGRSVAPRVPALRLRNRLVLARRYLPWPVAAVHVMAWGVRTLGEARAGHGLRPWLASWRDGVREPVRREPLAWRELVRIHRLGGRVLW